MKIDSLREILINQPLIFIYFFIPWLSWVRSGCISLTSDCYLQHASSKYMNNNSVETLVVIFPVLKTQQSMLGELKIYQNCDWLKITQPHFDVWCHRGLIVMSSIVTSLWHATGSEHGRQSFHSLKLLFTDFGFNLWCSIIDRWVFSSVIRCRKLSGLKLCEFRPFDQMCLQICDFIQEKSGLHNLARFIFSYI